MDSFLAEINSTTFWIDVLIGQVLFIGFVCYLIYSTRTPVKVPVKVKSPNSEIGS